MIKSEAACTSCQATFLISPSSLSTVTDMPFLPIAKATSFTLPTRWPFASITCIETSASLVNGLSFSIVSQLVI